MKKIDTHFRGSYDLQYMNHTIDSLIKDFMDKYNLDGLQLSTVQAPYIPTSRGYGVSDHGLAGVRKLVGTRTMYNVGGISMGYNTVALIQAKEQGLIKLEDKLSSYFKEFDSELYKDITLLDLMHHTSKINDFRLVENYDASKKYSTKEILKMIKEVGLNNLDVSLSPSNTYLIALIIEKVSGLKYEEFVRKYQLDVVGVKDTYFISELKNVKEDKLSDDKPMHTLFKQDPYYINLKEIAISQKDISLDENLIGFGDVFASAQDISVWDIGLAGTILTKDPTDANSIYKPIEVNGKTINASSGWEFTSTNGFMDIYGSNGGYSSYLSRFTSIDTLICVTLQTNKANIDFTELARNIANALLTDLGTKLDPNEVYSIDSYKNFTDTITSLKDNLIANNFEIFNEINHLDNALKVKLTTSKNTVLTFGNTKIGTKLINLNPFIGLELPLKISVYEDTKTKTVWINTINLDALSKKYHLEDEKIIKQIDAKLKEIIHVSSRVYAIH